MALFYPALVIGLGDIGKAVAEDVYANACGHVSALSEGIRCVTMSAYPPSESEDIESAVEYDPLPAFHLFADASEGEKIGRLVPPVDMAATLSIDIKDRLNACRRFLHDHISHLLGIGAEDALRAAEVSLMKPGDIKHLNLVIVLALDDSVAWSLLPEVTNILADMNSAEYSYLHVVPVFYVSDSADEIEVARLKSVREDILPAVSGEFAFIRCYPFSNQLDDLTILEHQADVIIFASFFLFVYLIPFSLECSPIEDIVSSETAEAADLPKKKAKAAAPSTACTAVGSSACYVPLAEVKRRLAFHLGHDLLENAVLAKEVKDPESVTAELRALPLFADLAEGRLVRSFIKGTPLNLKWDEVSGTLSQILIDESELRESIDRAAPDRWVELVDNYDYLVNLRMKDWQDVIDGNRRAVTEAMLVSGEESLPEQVDKVMRSYGRPLAVAAMLLAEIKSAVSEESHKFRIAKVVGAELATSGKRSELETEIASFPSRTSLIGRSVVLISTLAGACFMLAQTPILSLAGTTLSAAIVSGASYLHWRVRCARLKSCLKEYIDAVKEKYQVQLLAGLKDTLGMLDSAVDKWVESESEQLGIVRPLLGRIHAHYGTEKDRFHAMENGFIKSAVDANDIGDLYNEGGYANHLERTAKEIVSSGFLTGWRAMADSDGDSAALRRTLWPMLAGEFLGYRPAGGIGRFIEDCRTTEVMRELHAHLRTVLRHRHAVDVHEVPIDYAFCPPDGSPCFAATAADSLGIKRLMPYVPNALGVLRMEETAEPEVTSAD